MFPQVIELWSNFIAFREFTSHLIIKLNFQIPAIDQWKFSEYAHFKSFALTLLKLNIV